VAYKYVILLKTCAENMVTKTKGMLPYRFWCVGERDNYDSMCIYIVKDFNCHTYVV